MDDELWGQHGLERGGEVALRTPREVVLEVVALRPLRDSGDVIRVILIAFDPGDLATIELNDTGSGSSVTIVEGPPIGPRTRPGISLVP